jgi:hypothetical protein
MASKKSKNKQINEAAFFARKCTKFSSLVEHATSIGHRIGRRAIDAKRGYASWLIVRACVMAKAIGHAFAPLPTGFGKVKWLDHGSIAILCRALIERISVMLDIGDVELPEGEWLCRKHLIELVPCQQAAIEEMERRAFSCALRHV